MLGWHRERLLNDDNHTIHMQQERGLEGSLGGAVVGVQGPRKGQSNRDPKAVGSRLCG